MSNSPTQHQSQVFARQTSDILLDTKSVLIRPERPFTLTSGRISPVYVDCRRLIGFPQERAKLIQMAVAHLKSFHAQFDAVAGGETAGIAWAAWIAEKLDLPMAYIRKKPKGFGRNARIEGRIESGQHVLLVEDLATDGGSKFSFIDALHQAEALCQHCFVIFHYDTFKAGNKKLCDAGIHLHRLCTWHDVLERARIRALFDANQLEVVREFLEQSGAEQCESTVAGG